MSLFGENLAQFHKAAVQNIDLSHVLWPVHLPGEKQAVLQQEHLGCLFFWTNNPVFPHPGTLVQVQFYQAIMTVGGG